MNQQKPDKIQLVFDLVREWVAKKRTGKLIISFHNGSIKNGVEAQTEFLNDSKN